MLEAIELRKCLSLTIVDRKLQAMQKDYDNQCKEMKKNYATQCKEIRENSNRELKRMHDMIKVMLNNDDHEGMPKSLKTERNLIRLSRFHQNLPFSAGSEKQLDNIDQSSASISGSKESNDRTIDVSGSDHELIVLSGKITFDLNISGKYL